MNRTQVFPLPPTDTTASDLSLLKGSVDLSVVICSYNRCDALEKTLRSLFNNAAVNHATWEALVIDNNSTDDTREVAERLVAEGFNNLRYHFEPRQGKSYALNTGIRESRGKILAFTDDDCLVDSNWMASIRREFEADPGLGGIGGRVELYDRGAAAVAQRTHPVRLHLSRPDQCLSMIIGCNMAFRKNVFDRVGGFDVALGPGTKIGAVSEDLDFLYRAYKAGLKLVYSPNILVYHDHRRSNDFQTESLRKKYTIGRGALYCKHILMGDRDILRFTYWEIVSLLKSLFRDLVKRKSTKNHRTALMGLFVGAAYQFLKCISGRKRVRVDGLSSETGDQMFVSHVTKHK